jgi:GAF domain-containing protein
MINYFINYLRDAEDNDPSFLRMTRNILIFTIFATVIIAVVVSGFVPGLPRNNTALLSLIVSIVLVLTSLFLTLQGRPSMAKLVVPASLFVTVAFIANATFGLHDISIISLPVIIIIGTLLNGRRAGIIITPLAIATVLFIGITDISSVKTYKLADLSERTGIDDILVSITLLVSSSIILQSMISRLLEATRRARINEQSQIEANLELRLLQSTLERRVAERTEELNSANLRVEHRVRQLEAITQISEAITSVQELDKLLPRLAQLISQYLGHYHTGIFLLDEDHEYAILRAANSAGGKRMLDRGHRLEVGQTGIVGFVAATKTPRIALDVGSDVVFFDNPDLPGTRSEIALPMYYARQIIGVLDVQSTEANAFTQEDIEVLSTLANQVAVAIQNATSLQETRRLLAEAQSTVSGYITDAWQVLRPAHLTTGYQKTGSEIKLLEHALESEHIKQAVDKGETVSAKSNLTIPIRLRGQVIGIMNLKIPAGQQWDPDQIEIAEAVSERLSLAIETATLLKSTQRRADIERITADISGKISSSTRLETILQTAAQELSRALGGSDVLVQIEPTALKMSDSF